MSEPETPPRTRKPRGEYAKTKQTREAILDAALEVFAESGYRSGSIREVALRVGMSEPGLLHHFPSKPELLAAVLERRDHHSESMLPGEEEAGTLTLRGLIELASYNATIPGVVELYCVLSAEATAPDHPAHDYFTSRYENTRIVLTRAFRVLDGERRLLRGVTPEGAAIATIAMMDGLQVQWLLNRELMDMSHELRGFFRTFVDAEL
ncbi:TetR/AcrR family transcriptional regulator [Microbacterium rhizomatis]|uniref:TetR/AcrR family transcriptional regulator n=1 Tax=Microbacterium rhizomatis TaxID=1631477 RepID=A0A5J5J1Y5_9MICO|nr:TetR/AcrR family transcriptional regulator [Microbacterium rhizomatis]KAA9107699.1 TetR/AcrR family transcriptional regulator [Microbacterium rhizomatis]